MSENWNYRPSKKYHNTGIDWRYTQEKCHKHGMTQHVEVKEYSVKRKKGDTPLLVCQLCCQQNVKNRGKKEQINHLNKGKFNATKRGKW